MLITSPNRPSGTALTPRLTGDNGLPRHPEARQVSRSNQRAGRQPREDAYDASGHHSLEPLLTGPVMVVTGRYLRCLGPHELPLEAVADNSAFYIVPVTDEGELGTTPVLVLSPGS